MRSCTVLLVALAALGSGGAVQAQGATPADSMVRRADALRGRGTAAALDSAFALLRAAQVARPTAAGYAVLAESWVDRFILSRDSSVTDSTLVAAAVALRADSTLAQAHFARAAAMTVRGRPGEASESFLRALALDPDYPRADRLALGQLWRAGRYADAYRWGRRAAARDPRPGVFWDLGVACGFLLELACADSAFRQVLALDPKYTYAHGELAFLASGRGDHAAAIGHMRDALAIDTTNVIGIGGLAQMMTTAGDAAGAVALLEPVFARTPDGRGYGARSLRTLLGWALWETGDRARAGRLFDERLAQIEAAERDGRIGFQLFRERASIHALRGDREAALAATRRAVDEGWRTYATAELDDPMFRPVMDDPRFRRELARMAAGIAQQRALAGLPPR